MLKHVTTVNLLLAGAFVLPGAVTPTMAGPQDAESGILARLEQTVSAIDYLGELARRIEERDPAAVPMLLGATEAARGSEVERDAQVIGLRGEVSRLRLALDRMLDREGADMRLPGGVAAVGRDPMTSQEARTKPSSLPAGGYRSGAPSLTTGLSGGEAAGLSGSLPPLQHVDPDSRRRGTDPLPLEEESFTADAIRHGQLLYKAGRYAEAIQLLKANAERHAEARYWLTRAYRAVDREAEALPHLRLLAEDAASSPYDRYAKADLEFLEWRRKLEETRKHLREQKESGQ